MATIRSLLNPVLDEQLHESGDDSKDDLSVHESHTSRDSGGRHGHEKPIRKKQKVCKDGAIFKLGAIRGECRYPPYEDQDELLAAEHQLYEVYPVGKIATFPRHIPYNSEKKLFLDKTGRESFEVFQYQFSVPRGSSTITYTMLWDYNIGLVRTTPLFKCFDFPKTMPAKMMNRNTGLKEICHSITGGALVAQGYWIPYEAAKAVARTFCWEIRFALTPVFGRDFPDICLSPDSEGFGSFQIDPEITKQCTVQARRYRELEARGTPGGASSGVSSPQAPRTPTSRPQFKKIMPKELKMRESASEYSTDTSRGDKYELSSPSPQIAFTNPWSAVNSSSSASPMVKFANPWSPSSTTRSESPHGSSRRGHVAANIPRSHTPLDLLPPPRTPLFPAITMQESQGRIAGTAFSETTSPTDVSPKSGSRLMDVDEDYDAGSDDSNSSGGEANLQNRKKSSRVFTEAKAACVLMKLSSQRDSQAEGSRPPKRRASA